MIRMSAPEILSKIKSRVQTITGRYGLSGQLLDQVGTGRLIAGVGGGRMVSEARRRAMDVRRSIPFPMLFGEITDNPIIRDMAFEAPPAEPSDHRNMSVIVE
jgi:hypothetical protein